VEPNQTLYITEVEDKIVLMLNQKTEVEPVEERAE
jgi:hypothetical protein